MKPIRRISCCAVCLIGLIISGYAVAQDGRSLGEPGRTSKPSKQPNSLKNVYFGEQHMHTKNSFDGYTVG